jgi:hypothetical protein
VIRIKHLKGDDLMITEKRLTLWGRLVWLFGGNPAVSVRRFVGSCTVWHQYPGFRRCSTMTEGSLADIWERWKFERAK